MSAFLERTTGFEPRPPAWQMLWELSIASPPVSAVPLSCTFLALLSHQSHQIAGVDSISLVTSLVETGRHVSPRRWPAATTWAPVSAQVTERLRSVEPGDLRVLRVAGPPRGPTPTAE